MLQNVFTTRTLRFVFKHYHKNTSFNILPQYNNKRVTYTKARLDFHWLLNILIYYLCLCNLIAWQYNYAFKFYDSLNFNTLINSNDMIEAHMSKIYH